MAEIVETPIQSELDFFADIIEYDRFAPMTLGFVYDGLIDYNIIRPANGVQIVEN
jgi:hypothetical protein